MVYHVDCKCGTKIPVEVGQCGIEVTCPDCACAVQVPSLGALKEGAGDRHWMLSAPQKIVACLENGEEPFDGVCRGCQSCGAEWQVPIQLAIMAERILDDDGGIRPSLVGVKIAVSGGEERWEVVNFPLLLCSLCLGEFESSHRFAKMRSICRRLFYFGIFPLFVILAVLSPDQIEILLFVFMIVGAIAWILFRTRGSRVDSALMKWLEKIRWVPEAIAAEEEYRVEFGSAQPYKK